MCALYWVRREEEGGYRFRPSPPLQEGRWLVGWWARHCPETTSDIIRRALHYISQFISHKLLPNDYVLAGGGARECVLSCLSLLPIINGWWWLKLWPGNTFTNRDNSRGRVKREVGRHRQCHSFFAPPSVSGNRGGGSNTAVAEEE